MESFKYASFSMMTNNTEVYHPMGNLFTKLFHKLVGKEVINARWIDCKKFIKPLNIDILDENDDPILNITTAQLKLRVKG